MNLLAAYDQNIWIDPVTLEKLTKAEYDLRYASAGTGQVGKSKELAKILDIICEGPIEGPINPAFYYINNEPVNAFTGEVSYGSTTVGLSTIYSSTTVTPSGVTDTSTIVIPPGSEKVKFKVTFKEQTGSYTETYTESIPVYKYDSEGNLITYFGMIPTESVTRTRTVDGIHIDDDSYFKISWLDSADKVLSTRTWNPVATSGASGSIDPYATPDGVTGTYNIRGELLTNSTIESLTNQVRTINDVYIGSRYKKIKCSFYKVASVLITYSIPSDSYYSDAGAYIEGIDASVEKGISYFNGDDDDTRGKTPEGVFIYQDVNTAIVTGNEKLIYNTPKYATYANINVAINALFARGDNYYSDSLTVKVKVYTKSATYTRDFTYSGIVVSRVGADFIMPLPIDAYSIEISGTPRKSGGDNASSRSTDYMISKIIYTIPVNLIFPNTACVRLHTDTSITPDIANRTYYLRLLKVQIPTNYDPIAATYDGVWDGTFTTAWSDNPVWCLYDLLTNDRYGLGKTVSPRFLDKWGFYEIAKYCDDRVPSGYGTSSTERRFRLNCFITRSVDAATLIKDFLSVFRGLAYWGNCQFHLQSDRPSESKLTFSNQNVINGEFTYSGTSLSQRHSVCKVSWIDASDNWTSKYEIIEIPSLLARYGYSELSVTAFGCTSRGQAMRFGRWALFSEQMNNSMITFKASVEALIAAPGEIITVIDAEKNCTVTAVGTYDATNEKFLLDRRIEVTKYVNNYFKLYPQDVNAEQSDPISVVKTYRSLSGITAITITGISHKFKDGDKVFVAGTTVSESFLGEQYLITSIDVTSLYEYTISALNYNLAKFDDIDAISDSVFESIFDMTLPDVVVKPEYISGVSHSIEYLESTKSYYLKLAVTGGDLKSVEVNADGLFKDKTKSKLYPNGEVLIPIKDVNFGTFTVTVYNVFNGDRSDPFVYQMPFYAPTDLPVSIIPRRLISIAEYPLTDDSNYQKIDIIVDFTEVNTNIYGDYVIIDVLRIGEDPPEISGVNKNIFKISDYYAQKLIYTYTDTKNIMTVLNTYNITLRNFKALEQ